MREIELCPGCYKLTVKQPKDWFCVPCVSVCVCEECVAVCVCALCECVCVWCVCVPCVSVCVCVCGGVCPV